MLKIKTQYDSKANAYRFVMKGHCGFAPKGKDIVCAGCSALCLALAQTIQDNTVHMLSKPKIKIGDGRAFIEWQPEKEYEKSLDIALYTVMEGFKVLEHEYPEYIKII